MPKKQVSEAQGKKASPKGLAASNTTRTSQRVAAASPMPLTSYGIFELCIERARNLVKLHEAAHGKAGKPEKFTSDAHRAAIVLAVAALDAFVRDFIISRIRTLLADKSLALPPALVAHIKKFMKEDDLLDAARKDDLIERVEKAFRKDFERRSFQGTKNIDEYLRIAGYNDIFHDVAVKARLNEETLKDALDRFTLRRHAIAHRGDYDLTMNPPAERVITKKAAQDCIKLVCSIAKHMHALRAQL